MPEISISFASAAEAAAHTKTVKLLVRAAIVDTFVTVAVETLGQINITGHGP